MRVVTATTADTGVPGARTDAALLRSFATGEGAALGELFDRHHRAVYRFLGRLSGARHADLDDLVQGTFLEAARAAARYDGRAAVRTWLFGIAINVARHHARGNARRRRIVGDFGDDRPSEIPGPDRPDENAERRELLARLARAVDALSPELREVFVACEIEDLPGADVARVLGIPEGTLWRRLHDARKRIRVAVEGDTP
jgi:RNA polymerase sigma factor (sigma-70 family)